jgi:hypothetical protein
MWDILWTDPDRELVGEHRAKKEKDKAVKKTGSRNSSSSITNNNSAAPPSAVTARKDQRSHDLSSHPGSTKRRSMSTRRSSLSSSDSPFSFLRARGLRHMSAGGASGNGARSTKLKSSASSSLASPAKLGRGSPSPLSPAHEPGNLSRPSSAAAASISFDARSDISRATQTSPVPGKPIDTSHCELSSNISCHGTRLFHHLTHPFQFPNKI